MATRILPLPRLQWISDEGFPLAGGTLTTYEPGTTTPKATYQDLARTTPHTNPIVLNARGEPDAPIYWDGEYKVVLKTKAGVLVYEQDNYGDAEELTVSPGANVLVNGDFETDTDGDGVPDAWTFIISSGNVIALSTMNVASGARSLVFTTNDGVKAGTATGSLVPFVAGEALFFTGRTISNAANLTNQVIVDWYSDTTTLVSSNTFYDDAGTSVTSLTKITGNATAPATTKYFRLRLEGADGGGVNTGSTWFDALVCQTRTSAVSDAQTLDGLDSTQFLRSDISDAMTGSLTVTGDVSANDISASGNATVSGNVTVDSGVNTNAVITEDGIDRSSSGAETFNVENSGTGTMQLNVDGVRALLTSDEGAGNGLDADTLDGQHGSFYDDVPNGVKTVFYEAAAPTGYVQDTTINDRVLSVTSGAGGTTDGSWTISGLNVLGHALTEAEMASHNHGDGSLTAESAGEHSHGTQFRSPGTDTINSYPSLGADGTTAFANTDPAGAHTHTVTGSTASAGSDSAHDHGISHDGTWRPALISVIVCTRSK